LSKDSIKKSYTFPVASLLLKIEFMTLIVQAPAEKMKP